MKKLLLSFISVGMFVTVVSAQSQRCGTTEYYEIRKKSEPSLEQKFRDQEKEIAEWIANHPQAIKTKPQTKINFPDMPGFKPTGNESVDRANYAVKKEKYLNHQQLKFDEKTPSDAVKIQQRREQKIKDNPTFKTKNL